MIDFSVFRIILLLLLLETTPSDAADVKVSIIGGKAILNCPTSSFISTPDWMHYSLEAPDTAQHIYTRSRIESRYRPGGRHDVVRNVASLDLVITNLTFEDSGLYVCSDGRGSSHDTELTVTDLIPKCRSNVSLDNVLVENDCGLPQDIIQVSCSVGYRGNQPPGFNWNHSGDGDIVKLAILNDTSHGKTATSTLTVKASMQMNRTFFSCEVNTSDLQTGGKCSLSKITVLYVFNESMIRLTEGQHDSYECIANSSQNCTYGWHGNHSTSPYNLIHASGQTIQLQNIDVLRCFANCSLRNSSCLAVSSIFARKIDEVPASDNWLMVLLVLGAIFMLLIIIVIIILIYKKSNISNSCKWTRQFTPEPSNDQELRLLNKDCYSKRLKKFRSKLVDCLDVDNGLAERLCDVDVFSDAECNTLMNCTAGYAEQNNQFYQMFTKALKETESCYGKFREALLETDQEHVNNLLEGNISSDVRPLDKLELKIISAHKNCICNLIDTVNQDFIKKLEDQNVITKRHRLRILGASNDSRDYTLLTIMERRSFKHLTKFKLCLRETLQPHIIPALVKAGAIMEIHIGLDKPEIARRVADILTGLAQWNSIQEYLSHQQNDDIESLLVKLKKFVISIQSASTGSSINIVFLCEEIESLNNFERMYRTGSLKQLLENLASVITGKNMVGSIEIDEDLFNTNLEKCLSQMGNQVTVRIQIDGDTAAEQKVADALTKYIFFQKLKCHLSYDQIYEISSKLNSLAISFIGASVDVDSSDLILFMLCESHRALLSLQKFYYSGHLIKTLKFIFDIIQSENTNPIIDANNIQSGFEMCGMALGPADKSIPEVVLDYANTRAEVDPSSTATVGSDKSSFQNKEALQSKQSQIVSKTNKGSVPKQFYLSYLDYMPMEMMNIILNKTSWMMWGCFLIQTLLPGSWMPLNEYLKNGAQGFSNFVEVSSRYIHCELSSVCFSWYRLHCFLGKSIKKELLLKISRMAIERSKNILLTDLCVQDGFLDLAFKEKLITFDEKTDCESMPEKSNEMFVGFLYIREKRQIFAKLMKFLFLLEEQCKDHLTNHVISFGVHWLNFQKRWPLDRKTKLLINAACKNKVICSMNIDECVVCVKNKSKRTISEDVEDASQNLVTILFEHNCITADQRRTIDNLTNPDKTQILMKLLENGSIEMFEIFIDYLDETMQYDVIDLLQLNQEVQIYGKHIVNCFNRAERVLDNMILNGNIASSILDEFSNNSHTFHFDRLNKFQKNEMLLNILECSKSDEYILFFLNFIFTEKQHDLLIPMFQSILRSKLFETFESFLLHTIDADSKLLLKLVDFNVINHTQMRTIEGERTSLERNRQLLKVVLKTTTKSISTFLTALVQSGDAEDDHSILSYEDKADSEKFLQPNRYKEDPEIKFTLDKKSNFHLKIKTFIPVSCMTSGFLKKRVLLKSDEIVRNLVFLKIAIIRQPTTDLCSLSLQVSSLLGYISNNSNRKIRLSRINEERKLGVKNFIGTLITSIDPSGYILQTLLAQGVLTPEQKTEVESKTESEIRSDKLLQILFTTKHPEAFSVFVEALRRDNDELVQTMTTSSIYNATEIHSRITNPAELTRMKERKLKAIVENLSKKIITSVDPSGHILLTLHENGVLTSQQKTEVESLPSAEIRSERLLLELSTTQIQMAFSVFVEALKQDHAELVQVIDEMCNADVEGSTDNERSAVIERKKQPDNAMQDSKDLMCAVCKGVIDDPRNLSCRHTFCLRCLYGVCKASKEDGNLRDMIKCPLCRTKIKLSDGQVRLLPRNRVLRNLTETRKLHALKSVVSEFD